MARIELIDEQPLNVSLSEPQTLNESITPQENINVETTDGWYERSYTETDPIFTQSTAYSITEQDITNWNAKSDFSGDYDDLTDKPTIPSKTSELTNDSGFLTQHQDISGKVDKEEGKGLSTNDFTDTYKNNIDSNTSARHTHNNKNVLDDISSSDISNWDGKQDNLVSGTNIKTINNQSLLGSGNITIQGGGGNAEWGSIGGTLSDQTDLATALNSKADTSSLSTVATSGSYNDLTNKPTIPTVPSTLSSFTDDLGSSPIHTHSQYLTTHQDISGKVDKVAGKGLSTNDFTDTYKTNVDNNTYARHTHSNKSVLDGISSSDITNWNNKSTFSGDYDDLTNKPTISSPNILTLTTSSAQRITAALNYMNVKLDTVKCATTNTTLTSKTFTPIDSSSQAIGIQIPAGVSKVKASSCVQVLNNNNTSAMYYVSYINKHDGANTTYSTVVRSLSPSVPAGGNGVSIACPETLIDVEEGDVLVMRIYKSLATSAVNSEVSEGVRTWLTVEVVE